MIYFYPYVNSTEGTWHNFCINFFLRRKDAAHSSQISIFIAHNVPAVTDVWAE
jgi:hypothetical protein